MNVVLIEGVLTNKTLKQVQKNTDGGILGGTQKNKINTNPPKPLLAKGSVIILGSRIRTNAIKNNRVPRLLRPKEKRPGGERNKP